ncbi:DUF429 domain-containing protein [uncultured Devosia sp.]|uniref:DUF429 domain-containing protein n=1 Tax=uncultured Devosia sp. TaxID=211434 RepID=UPI0035CA910C
MQSVLGIDAAWTTTQPSGVALVAADGDSWRLLAVGSSYGAFYRRAGLADAADAFDATRLLAAAAALTGHPITLVAADIPLAYQPINARRASDNAVSRLYGARHASTHTPSVTRPGALADRMTADFAAAGYPLRTAAPVDFGLIEVYPHPALIELAAAPRRLPYKIGKTAKYWPGLPLADRRANLLAQWRIIVALLDARIAGVAAALPLPSPDASGRQLKAWEDALDAVVCAWVGMTALTGRALPLGDHHSAIWVPASPS